MVDAAGNSGEEFAFTVPARTSVPIAGDAKRFPVRRIYCVGRNYREHIREMGGDERELPFFFQKPTDAIVLSGSSIAFPIDVYKRQKRNSFSAVIGSSSGRSSVPDSGAGG